MSGNPGGKPKAERGFGRSRPCEDAARPAATRSRPRLRGSRRVVARRSAALGVFVVMLLVACVPDGGVAPPPQAPRPAGCDRNRWPAGPKSYEDAQRRYRGPVWSGGDGGSAVRLGGNRVLWLYADTYVGPVYGKVRVNNGMVHNSIRLQTGQCFQAVQYSMTDQFAAPKLGDDSNEPGYWAMAFQRPNTVKSGPGEAIKEFYWPGEGYLYAGKVRVPLHHLYVKSWPGTSRLDEWVALPSKVATIDPTSLRVEKIGLLGQALTVTARDPLGSTRTDRVNFLGSSLLVEDRIYMVGYSEPTDRFPDDLCRIDHGLCFPNRQYLARNRADLSGVWEYWTGTGWSTEVDAARPMDVVRADGVTPESIRSGPLSIVPYQGGYLAAMKRWDAVSDDVSAWVAKGLTGPWVSVGGPAAVDGRIADAFGEVPGTLTYGVGLMNLPGMDGVTVRYSVNAWFPEPATPGFDATMYGLRFRTPFNLPGQARYGKNTDWARGIALLPDGRGLELDWSGVRWPVGPPGGEVLADTGIKPVWRGWDIARDVALLPDGTGGYVLDGWGGVHGFAVGYNPVPPTPSGAPYWKGWDIARGITVLPDGTGGYVLDGWGGVHPFSLGANPKPQPAIGPYWKGWDIARSVVAVGNGQVYVLDGWGGVHVAGGAPRPTDGPYWRGKDVARGLSIAGPGVLAIIDGRGDRHEVAVPGLVDAGKRS